MSRVLSRVGAGLCLLLAACGGSEGTGFRGAGPGIGAASQWPATTPVADPPPLPVDLAPLLNVAAPLLDTLLLPQVVDLTDPVAFGLTFAEIQDPALLDFELRAVAAQLSDGSRPHPFHQYGHPAYNGQVASVPVRFASASGEVELYGEIMLPKRGTVPPAAGPFPTVVMLEGLQGNIGMYRWWHALFADAGYLVFAFDFTGQGKSGGSDGDTQATRVPDTIRALDYLLQESPVRHAVDRSRLGLIGHSMGAITTLSVQSQDPRYRAAVAAAPIADPLNDFVSSDIPIMLQTGDHDGPILPVVFINPVLVRPIYDRLQADKALIVTEAASHAQHSNVPLLPTPTWSIEIAGLYSLAWMDYYLRGDRSQAEVLRTAHPHLSFLHGSEVVIGGERTVLRSGLLDAAAP